MRPRSRPVLHKLLLAIRWTMAPLCAGLAVTLLLVIAQFFRELAKAVGGFEAMTGSEVVVTVLKLVDLVLVGNLVLMIITAGVEIYRPAPDSPEEAAHDSSAILDLASLKLKVVAAISAISVVYLLEALLNIATTDKQDVLWGIALLLAFVVTGVLLAVMDWLSARSH